MTFLRRFLAFWYDFIVGDDWLIAAGVVLLLAAAGVLARGGLQTTAWLLMPIGVVVVLGLSLRRAAT